MRLMADNSKIIDELAGFQTQALARDLRGCLWLTGLAVVLLALGCGGMVFVLPVLVAMEAQEVQHGTP